MKWTFKKQEPRKELTELEIITLLVKKLGDVDTDVDKEAEELIFKELKKVEGFLEYLRITSMRDIKRYFSASTPVEQLTIKGAFSRTNYLRSKILNIKD